MVFSSLVLAAATMASGANALLNYTHVVEPPTAAVVARHAPAAFHGVDTSMFTQKRGAGVTGCTCCGLDVYMGSDMNYMTEYMILNYASGAGSSNAGYCFVDGALEARFVALISTAITTGVSNAYVNVPGGACATNLIAQFHDCIVGHGGDTVSEWVHTGCTYPAGNFTPDDCYCGWHCNDGYVQCGNSCVDPAVTACASSVPVARREGPAQLPVCPAGMDTCQIPMKNGFECVDTTSDLESCGACPFHPASVDCTTLPGVDAVGCVGGKCVIDACRKGWALVDGECQLLE